MRVATSHDLTLVLKDLMYFIEGLADSSANSFRQMWMTSSMAVWLINGSVTWWSAEKQITLQMPLSLLPTSKPPLLNSPLGLPASIAEKSLTKT
jgi:hypothetical protein